jgi:hypothetical protein
MTPGALDNAAGLRARDNRRRRTTDTPYRKGVC